MLLTVISLRRLIGQGPGVRSGNFAIRPDFPVCEPIGGLVRGRSWDEYLHT